MEKRRNFVLGIERLIERVEYDLECCGELSIAREEKLRLESQLERLIALKERYE